MAAGVALSLAACQGAQGSPEAEVEVPAPPAETRSDLRIDTVATGLQVPWGLARLPDGRWLVTERPGRLRMRRPDGSLVPAPLLELPVHGEDPEWHPESGLLGIAVSPLFDEDRQVFLVGTFPRAPRPQPGALARLRRRVFPGAPSADDLPFENRVLRLTLRGDSVADVRTVLDGLHTYHYHAGGALAFGPDGQLYVSVGDGRLPPLAQDHSLPVGKLLRVTPDGGIPADNPDPASTVWASGLRNTQALAWLPDGALLGVEHGPTGLPGEAGRAGRDELNLLRSGADYGWPTPQADGSDTPLRRWESAVAPAGLAVDRRFTTDDTVRVVVGQLRGGIERLTLVRHGARWRVLRSERWPLEALRRTRSIVADTDGSLLLTTSNREIRGSRQSADDLIVRIRLPAPTPPS